MQVNPNQPPRDLNQISGEVDGIDSTPPKESLKKMISLMNVALLYMERSLIETQAVKNSKDITNELVKSQEKLTAKFQSSPMMNTTAKELGKHGETKNADLLAKEQALSYQINEGKQILQKMMGALNQLQSRTTATMQSSTSSVQQDITQFKATLKTYLDQVQQTFEDIGGR